MRLVNYFFIFSAIMGSFSVLATSLEPRWEITPFVTRLSANWYNPETAGSGWAIGVIPERSLLYATYYGYDELGAQRWYALQTTWVASTAQQLVETGIIGYGSDPLYQPDGGACISCPYQAPVIQYASDDIATMTFNSTTKMTFDYQGTTTTNSPIELDVIKSLDDTIVGVWEGDGQYIDGTSTEEQRCRLTITKTSNPTTQDRWERYDTTVREIPIAGSAFFEVDAEQIEGESPSHCQPNGSDDDLMILNPNKKEFTWFLLSDAAGYKIVENGQTVGWKVTNHNLEKLYLVGPNELLARRYKNENGKYDLLAEYRMFRVEE